MSERTGLPPTRPAIALLTDVACVLVFCTIGRRSHSEGLTLTGIAETAWPFITGTVAGWLAARAYPGDFKPSAIYPTGLIVWASTVIIGMLLRKATSAGTAPSFIVVATLTTAALLIGWRAVAAAVARR
ncbi:MULTISPECIES: DUF3054 domain-containing protein [Mycobacteriaceae]|uniref:DUF3054 domain-containing protein n=1 Tax=Mycobacteriaceae TaxID=1762 RepID=UPI000381BDDB|nr:MULTISPECIES: DUF3054 domain-containing protein [Mycobacteriaceae]AHC23574.2 membrane protein [Mycolicibacterium neoaurum VKM Ac-1815D]AMO04269.1 membrane protein [Mycolicibacterium neoaurum]AXK77445.1 DUF3054 domain-containing protein [Mycolicibacterium neoaurum]KJQ48985.1 membrane protein [Mycolicibacterium neoaurum]KUM07545.1 hypothetical protein AVZ31_16435 [Mycolicibacterium neoaurum]